jgi:two-component system, chemotaxis family, chemotaxis protein CheY
VITKSICLIIDASDVVRKVMRLTVEHLGFQADEAATTTDALTRCKLAMPTVLVLDWRTPGSSTIEFLSALRSMPNGKSVKVLYMTANNDSAEIGRAISAGANDHMFKPFYRVTLEAKIAAMTTESRVAYADEASSKSPIDMALPAEPSPMTQRLARRQ